MINEKTKILIIDVETTNTLEDPLVYDLGFRVFDLRGNVYEEASLVNRDVFTRQDLMKDAFYADKIPQYWREIWNKKRKLVSWREIKWRVWDACLRHNVEIVTAHNARFDYRATHRTQRYITTSQWRWFFPYGVTWWDTLKMARMTFKNNPDYAAWCAERGYILNNGQPRYTAEVVYKYITGNENFQEAHTGLEDVKIEMDIFLYCMIQNPDLDGRLWAEKN